MSVTLTTFLGVLIKLGAAALIFNEVRGAVLSVPVLYGMYHSGAALMAIWFGFCSLAGIALSVIVPIIAAKRLERLAQSKLVALKTR
ncbi:MAG TPA: hypothetical protein DCS24_00885 [Erythrobacter sp.]|nr:hypothetical protein [Erythrobacter sp.]